MAEQPFSSRKNIRLPSYDYTQCGGYFVTICTHNRRKILGQIRRDDPCGRPKTRPSSLGLIAIEELKNIAEKYGILVDYYAIMPDHIHMVLFFRDSEQNRPLGQFIGAYKSIVSNKWLNVCKSKGIVMGKLWQERYYDHIIRNDADLDHVRAYIDTNPDRWLMKREAEEYKPG